MAITIEMLMEQAQVYASAWSLVGGVFDQGNQLQVANEEKARLEDMLQEFLEESDADASNDDMEFIAESLIQWHQKRIHNISTMLEAKEGTKLCIGEDDTDPIELKGDYLRGFRTALIIAKAQFENFPLSIKRKRLAKRSSEL